MLTALLNDDADTMLDSDVEGARAGVLKAIPGRPLMKRFADVMGYLLKGLSSRSMEKVKIGAE